MMSVIGKANFIAMVKNSHSRMFAVFDDRASLGGWLDFGPKGIATCIGRSVGVLGGRPEIVHRL